MVGWCCGLHTGKLPQHGPPHLAQPALHTPLLPVQSMETSARPVALPDPTTGTWCQCHCHGAVWGTRESCLFVLSLNIDHYFAVLFSLSFFILWFQGVFCCDRGWLLRLVHVGGGAACLLGVFVAVLLTETRLVQFVRTQLLPRYTKKDT